MSAWKVVADHRHGVEIHHAERGYPQVVVARQVVDLGTARIIAAAPELLAACEYAEEWLWHHGGVCTATAAHGLPKLADLRSRLSAALAKARGE